MPVKSLHGSSGAVQLSRGRPSLGLSVQSTFSPAARSPPSHDRLPTMTSTLVSVWSLVLRSSPVTVPSAAATAVTSRPVARPSTGPQTSMMPKPPAWSPMPALVDLVPSRTDFRPPTVWVSHGLK